MFVKFNGDSSAVHLYKHSAGNAVEIGALATPELNIEVSPNPVSEEARICLPAAARGAVVMRILDVRGNIVETFSGISARGFSWRPGNLPRGVYLLQATVGQRRYAKKILVQ
jgi:hypothetical protein